MDYRITGKVHHGRLPTSRCPMHKTRAELDAALDELAKLMETRVAEDPDNPHLIDEFAGIADEIAEAASDADRPHVWSRTQCILRDNGMIPGDDEPCSD